MGDGRSVWSEIPGLHAAYSGRNNRQRLRKEKQILKSARGSDRGLQPTLVKMEWLVIVCH